MKTPLLDLITLRGSWLSKIKWAETRTLLAGLSLEKAYPHMVVCLSFLSLTKNHILVHYNMTLHYLCYEHGTLAITIQPLFLQTFTNVNTNSTITSAYLRSAINLQSMSGIYTKLLNNILLTCINRQS